MRETIRGGLLMGIWAWLHLGLRKPSRYWIKVKNSRGRKSVSPLGEGISLYTPNWVAKSSMFFAAKSTGTRGADSPVPGPFSPGRAMCAVRKPFDAAERRSSLCAAHIITSSGRRFNAAAVMR